MHDLRAFAVAVVLALAATGTLLAADGADAGQGALADDVAVGVEVYVRYYCGVCHQFEAAGTGGGFGPSHDGAGDLAAARLLDPNYRGRATTPEEYLRESIVDPDAYIVPGYAATPHRMPAYEHLEDHELDALVALLLRH